MSIPGVNLMVVFVYTGTGGGKTTAALGVALRAIGHGKKVVVVQFMKWWKNTGEYKAQKKLRPNLEIYQFGRRGWIGLKNLDERDKRLAEKGLKFAENVLREKRLDILILDEINLAVHCGLLKIEDVENLLMKVPPNVHVFLTGRYAPKRLMRLADFVVEVRDRKKPKEIKPIKGVNY